MSPILLLAAACAPQDAQITGTYHTWLAANSSATVDEGDLNVENQASMLMDCRYDDFEEPDRMADSTCDWKWDAEGNDAEVLNPADDSIAQPNHHNWLESDAFYLLEGDIEAYRSEAIITSEGDFQLTFHHDLGKGQDYRVAMVIDPAFEPTQCIQSGATCFTLEGENVDDDNDGWADFDDPDCLEGNWETGFDARWECNDGVDNDNDGSADAADSDCPHPFATEDASCSNNTDDDGDSWADEDDFDCIYSGSENGATNDLFACSDGNDNDNDGDVDADDAECESAIDGDEGGRSDGDRCRDDFDDDGDGWTDKDDPDCDLYDVEAGWGFWACNDGVDNDDDGDVDADDADCLEAMQAYETPADVTCSDGEDNDEDGWTDEDDPDCAWGAAEDNTFFGSMPCNDGIDNDEDGDTGTESDGVDSYDPDCQNAFSGGAEAGIASGTCTDFTDDDDGDGWGDDVDPDCIQYTKEKGFWSVACNDSLDNDGDGLADADDPDCVHPLRLTEAELAADTDCLDGDDNDGDGLTDGEDGGCLIGDYEADFESDCNDGEDNEGVVDGDIDALDGDCVSPFDFSEDGDDLCADLTDNDGDGWIDGLDSDCGLYGYEVGFGTAGCANGLDDDEDGAIDGLDDGCTGASDPYETEGDECADGLDNDGDGWTDSADADCIVLDTPYEANQVFGNTECNDGVDNDDDGDIDADDEDCNSENTLSMDNVEAFQDPGEPIAIPVDRYEVVENWSSDEDGQSIYYLNAGAYQRNPADSGDNWFFPSEWYSGYAHSKFAAEEFESAWIADADAVSNVNETTTFSTRQKIRTYTLGNQAWYIGADARNPDPEGYADWVSWFNETADVWAAELNTYAGLSYEGYDYKVEGNEWRPIDETESGLDNWVEVHRSWVKIDDSSVMEAGGRVSGDFQIYLSGYEAISQMVVQGSFVVDEVQAEKWHNGVLEDELRERNNTPVCE